MMANTIAARMARSTAQAMARGTGPARRSVSSMPSGVATFLVVSSMPRFSLLFRFCASAPAHGVEELRVGLGRAQLVDEEFGRLELVHREEEFPQHPDLLQHRLVDEQLLAPGAGAVDVDRRVDALLVHAPVEVHLQVAGALELLIDYVVHAAAGVDERGGDDGERAAFLS